jgi:branched-chain amino acid transport system substrate-binding protein
MDITRRTLGAAALAMLARPDIALSAEAPKEIKIGLLFGLTGVASPIGPLQVEGARLAINEINAAGGVPWGEGKVKVSFVVKDDETKPDVAIRRFREMMTEDKVDVVVGQTFAPISGALNEQVKKTPLLYFPVNVVAASMFEKARIAPSTFAVHGSAYSAGYGSAAYIIEKMKPRKVVFFGPAYAFGQDQWRGAKAAFDKAGMSVEYLESPVGTNDFTPYLMRIIEMKPDWVMLAHWGADAINVLKQSNEVGLKKHTSIWFDWMTDAFGSGVPPEALDGVYSLMSWYYDLSGFKDQAIVDEGAAFTKKYVATYGAPPDPYAAMAYTGVCEAMRGISLAQSTDPAAVAKAIEANPVFRSMKGEGRWRADHEPSFKYNAFVVVGKGLGERKDPHWDLVRVIDAYTGDDYLQPLQALGY